MVALITDFGLKDPYVGLVKAVIHRINPEVDIVDVTHYIPKFNVVLAAHVLKISRSYFPKGTVFLVVVDPGVGGPRRPIMAVSRRYAFVGPDNGVLVPSLTREQGVKVYEIDVDAVRFGNVSYTFHGRDVFAPAAAYLSLGVPPNAIGREVSIEGLTKVEELPRHPEVIGKRAIRLGVIHVDDFGNLILDSDLSRITSTLKVGYGDEVLLRSAGSTSKARIVRTFAEVCRGCLAIYEGTYRLAEVAVNQGSASRTLKVGSGGELVIQLGR